MYPRQLCMDNSASSPYRQSNQQCAWMVEFNFLFSVSKVGMGEGGCICALFFNPFLKGKSLKKADILRSGWLYAFTPPLRPAFVKKFFVCVFYLRLWFYVFWNGFYTRKVIFIQLQEFPTPPYCRCCSVTKRSDSGIAEALKALKMHFWDPSQWDKMCFEYHRVIFHWKKWVNIFTFAYGQGQGGWPPPPPPRVSLAVKYPLSFDDFLYLSF